MIETIGLVHLVCGGRDYKDREYVFKVLDQIHADIGISKIVHGAARGADSIGWAWAVTRGIEAKAYPAKWNEYGKRAGSIRNQEMLDSENIDAVIAFPGGSGTADMVSRAKKAGINVMELNDRETEFM